MKADSRLLGWGVFLIALGAAPLAVASGAIAEETVRGWWSLWPLLLIVLGVALLARGLRMPVAGVVVAGALGLMVGVALAGGLRGIPSVGCPDDRGAGPFTGSSGELEDGATMELDLDCGDLNVAAEDGSTWRIEGSGRDGKAPAIDASDRAVTVRSGDDGPNFAFLRPRERWAVTIPSVALELAARIDAGRGTLDLAGATIDRLSVDANASELRLVMTGAERVGTLDAEMNAASATIVLPEADMEGTIALNAGALDLCVATGVGLRIRTDANVTVANNFDDRGMSQSGDTWETQGFEAAQSQIVLGIEANAGSVELNPDDGCTAD